MKFYERSLQAPLSYAPRGSAAHSRVLARLASLAQIRELARRLSLCWLNARSVKKRPLTSLITYAIVRLTSVRLLSLG